MNTNSFHRDKKYLAYPNIPGMQKALYRVEYSFIKFILVYIYYYLKQFMPFAVFMRVKEVVRDLTKIFKTQDNLTCKKVCLLDEFFKRTNL